jgi:hypothetical protein
MGVRGKAFGEPVLAEGTIDPVDEGARLGREKASRGVVDRDTARIGVSGWQEADQATFLKIAQDLGHRKESDAEP